MSPDHRRASAMFAAGLMIVLLGAGFGMARRVVVPQPGNEADLYAADPGMTNDLLACNRVCTVGS